MILSSAPDGAWTEAQLAEEVGQMETAVSKLRTSLRAERRGGGTSRSALEETYAEAVAAAEVGLNELDRLKAVSKAHKSEIDEWKAWFVSQDGQDVTAALALLNVEISWRAEEIAQVEGLIQGALTEQLAARGRVELLRSQLTARDENALEGPIEADPRLVAANAALGELRATLDSVAVERPRPRRGRQSWFDLYKVSGGEFRFNLTAPNGEVVLTSERYRTEAGARNGIESVRHNAEQPARFEQRASSDDKPYFVLKAGNGEIVGVSQSYSSERAAVRGIDAVARHAIRAEIRAGR